MTRSITSIDDISKEEFSDILVRSEKLKKSLKSGESVSVLDGKVIGLLFEKPSTRTRTSFQTAVLKMKGSAIYLAADKMQLSRGEPIKDTARILGSYLDGIIARVYKQNTIEQLTKYAGVPVINGLSDTGHPTQIISDFLTVKEKKGHLDGLTLAFIGDGNNVANSLLLGGAINGMNITIASPKGYEPDEAVVTKAHQISDKTGSDIKITHRPKDAAKGADVLYTDVWVSMGEEDERKKRLKAFEGYQINADLLSVAKDDAIVMHCLPAHRGLEITDDMMESPHSAIWSQGENKLYGAVGLLSWIYGGN